MKAWYFPQESNRLRYCDNRQIIIGETHSVKTDREIECCKWGLHGSKRIIDALGYAAGPIIYRVELSGEIDVNADQVAAEHREYIWGFDAADLLRDFARRCALDVIHLWAAPPVVIEYLKTSNDDLRDAAWDAARDAAWGAARAAAWDVAWGKMLDKFNRRLTSMVIAESKKRGIYETR